MLKLKKNYPGGVMSEQFKDQGGPASMDPSPLARRLTSNLASYLNSEKKADKTSTES
jgi:hypothetical protein